MPISETLKSWCRAHPEFKLIAHLEGMPTGTVAGKWTDPNFKDALEMIQGHVIVATDFEASYFGLGNFPNIISDKGKEIKIGGNVVQGNNSTTLSSGAIFLKEKMPNTLWILCGGGLATAELSLGFGPTYWIVRDEDKDDQYSGVNTFTDTNDVVAFLKWLAEEVWNKKEEGDDEEDDDEEGDE